MNTEYVKQQEGVGQAERTRNRVAQKPDVDIRETDAGIVLYADMPGVAVEGLGVTLENNVLTIEGDTVAPSVEKHSLAYSEFGRNDFKRVFTLSEEIDRDKITATMKDGVLKLVLPKVAVAPKKITVQPG